MPRKRNVKPSRWIEQKDEDLRIHDATPEEVAQAIIKGGAKPRPAQWIPPFVVAMAEG